MNHITSTYPKARKEHDCDGCLDKIEIGLKYHRHIFASDGTIIDSKMCCDCNEFSILSDYEDGSYRGQLKQDKIEDGWIDGEFREN